MDEEQSALPVKLFVLADRFGAACTINVTCTVKEPEPIVKVTLPVYVFGASFTFKLEVETLTLDDVAPPESVAFAGLTYSQFDPSDVFALAVQVPVAPQFVSTTACAAASLTLATPINDSDPGEALIQPACTINETLSVCVALLDGLEKLIVVV